MTPPTGKVAPCLAFQSRSPIVYPDQRPMSVQHFITCTPGVNMPDVMYTLSDRAATS